MRFNNYAGRVMRAAIISSALMAICAIHCAATEVFAAMPDKKTRSRAERALREGEFELAEKMYRKLLEENARDTQSRLGLSFALYKQRNLLDAYDHAARVIATEPLSARAHSLIGSIVLSGGDFRMSVEEFRTALSLKEDDAMAIAGLAMVDFYENRLGESLEGLRRAVFINPNEPDFVFSLAQAAARAERYREAADAYERFLNIAPRTDEDRRARIRGLIDFLRYLGSRQSLYDVSGSTQTSVSFEMPSNRPIIKVRVNGSKEQLRFVLDTGSGISVISDETAKRLGIKPVARGGMARAVGGKFEIVYGFLQSLELGEVRVENVPVYIRRFYHDEVPVDGYIGLAIITKYITTLDYGARTFSLRRNRTGNDPVAKNSPEGIDIPVRTTSSGFLSGEVQVEGVTRPLNFIIDTGASISVVSEKLIEREELSGFMQPARMRVYGAAGIAEGVKTLTLPRVLLGNHARSNVEAAVLDLEPVNETTGFVQSGIVGGNFLRHFRIIFDFKKSTMRLEPLAAAASISEPKSDAKGVTSR